VIGINLDWRMPRSLCIGVDRVSMESRLHSVQYQESHYAASHRMAYPKNVAVVETKLSTLGSAL